MSAKKSPTARTLEELRKRGWLAQVVEKYNSFCKVRIDLFSCIDILCLDHNNEMMAIQACAGDSHAARCEKSMAEPKLARYLHHGRRFQVWSWAKKGGRGMVKKWECRVEELILAPDGFTVIRKLDEVDLFA